MRWNVRLLVLSIGTAVVMLSTWFLCSTAFAQTNSGSISGIVRDPNGSVIPMAAVRILNVGTNAEITLKTVNDGYYEAPVLPTGRYQVEVSAPGFKTKRVGVIDLAVGEKARVDVELPVGEVGEAVMVLSQTRTDTETTAIGDTIGIQRITDLPVNGRDFTLLLSTVPGSVQSSNFFQTSINGIPTSFGQSVLVDGIDAGRGDLNGLSNVLGRTDARVSRVSMDSIQEVQVLDATYSSQYGQAIGTIINPITKSGTNDYHGGVFEYFRNEALDARDFFSPAPVKFRMNQFGGNLSGRVVPDKLFFFTNYEGVRQTSGTILQGFVPTAAFRTQFVPAVKPVLDVLPLPNTSRLDATGNLGLFVTQKDRTLREDTGSVKLDYRQSERSQFSARYNLNDSTTITPYGVGTDQTATADLRVQLFKLSHTYNVAANAVNEFAFGINRNVARPDAGPSTLPILSFLFVDQAIANPGPAQFNLFRIADIYQFLDTYSRVQGNHSFKAGTDVRLNRTAAEAKTQFILQFFGVQDFANAAPLIGVMQGNPLQHYENENYSFFFNDDWKVRPRLTLNLGMRYEVNSTTREKNGNIQNFDLATRTFTPKGAKLYDVDWNNFAPRFGLAFDIFGNQKTVLRGGYGIFYDAVVPISSGTANTFPSVTIFFPSFPINPAQYANPSLADRSANVIQKDLATTYAQQWSFNIQQDLRIGVLQVGYVGNHVVGLFTNGVVTPRNMNPTLDAFGTRPIPGLGSVYEVGTYPQSSYHAMQAVFRRNLSKGLRFNLNYTWSHEMDNVIGFFKDYQNYQDLNADRASGDHDIRHNFTFDASYDVPSLRGLFRGLPRWLADGWQLNSITQARTGFPVNVTVTGGVFGGALRPNYVTGVPARPSNYSLPDHQFNPDAFAAPPTGQFGNVGRNSLRGPSFAQVDFSIFKSTKLTETSSVQLRLEIFNLFNHTNFADPYAGLNKDPITNSLTPSAVFGQSTSTVGNQLGGLLGAGGPRQIQLSVRFVF